MFAKTIFCVLLLVLTVSPVSPEPARFSDLFTGRAVFRVDDENPPPGADFAMHFISTLRMGDELWAYYINNYRAAGEWKSTVGLAVSTDGLEFEDRGIVLDIGGAWQWVFEAETDLSHAIGRLDGDGWSAVTGDDDAGYLCYGPYTTGIPRGDNTASFVLMIDNNSADDLPVVNLDVYDATSGAVLAERTVRRREFEGVFEYQVFNIDFTSAAGHMLEFRTYWFDVAYIKEDKVAVSQGQSPWWDHRLASFPGIWLDDGVFFLVYEGANGSPGDIGLATSTDGVSFVKHPDNPILVHGGGWESVNIGTPSLWKEGDLWYLFYHGFDGNRVQIGVATGTDLLNMNKYWRNPIIPAGPAGSWEEGTAGWRSIVKQDGVYYMAYEGSTAWPFSSASWSTGMARSNDLLNWRKYSANPVLPRTGSGFGYDGPEIVFLDDTAWIYFRLGPNETHRAELKLLEPRLERRPRR